MKFLRKLKSGNFWISLISAGVLIAEGIFDFEIKTEYLNQILLGLMGILTLFGIVSDHGESSVILNTTPSNDIQEEKVENSSASVSNIKSICDTVSLLLNKVSINSNLDVENVADIINEVKEINEALHKETEKEEQTNVVEENKKGSEENIQEEIKQTEMGNTPVEIVSKDIDNEVVDKSFEEKQELETAIIKPIENEIQEISIVND